AMHPEFAPVAFVAAFSLFLALPWHWRAGSVATLSIMARLLLTNIIYAVDAILWVGSVDIVAPWWCDITVNLFLGSKFALPAACLCICIHLERLSSVRSVLATPTEKQRQRIFEASMCFGVPIIFGTLLQDHRFDIVEDCGCRSSTYFSVPFIFIISIPPLAMAILALVSVQVSHCDIISGQISFAARLKANRWGLTTSRYWRLVLMGIVQMVLSACLTIFTLWITHISVPIRAWTSWEDVHGNFSHIEQVRLDTITVSTSYGVRWTVPVSTFIFVTFFAFEDETISEYQKLLRWVQRTMFNSSKLDEGLGPRSFQSLAC
ncbi:STE3-like pheromone receptor, partial [Mycena galopus ATCC 62051]